MTRRPTFARAACGTLPGALLILAGCDGAVAPPAPDSPARGDAASARAESPAARKAIRFTDATARSGVDMIMTCGSTPSREILDVDGGGLVLFDFDGDRDLDLFVANGATMDDPEHGPGSRLYRNLLHEEGAASDRPGGARFEDVTAASGVSLTRWAMGATAGDYDGDGDDDLHVCCYGPNVLLRNDGGGRFTDVTDVAGVGDDRWSTSSAFGDLDGDGDLDLYVVNYIVFDPAQPPPRARHKDVEVMAGPHGLVAQHDVLFENIGDGTFRDVTAAAGCLPPKPAYGLNVVIVDFDLDGRQDVFVGNDSMANFLFHNVGGGASGVAEGGTALRFEEIGEVAGVAANFDGAYQATMGIAIADVDGNGYPDMFSTNFANDTNTLHVNLGGPSRLGEPSQPSRLGEPSQPSRLGEPSQSPRPGGPAHLLFEDRTRQYGLGLMSRPFLGWACGFFDWDHDGDEDLLMFNGHVYPEASVEAMDSPYKQVPLLFAREDRRFERVRAETAGAWLAEAGLDRCAAFGDLDADGDVDAVVGALNGPVRVLLSETADAGPDWLIVELADGRPDSRNHRGLGARLELRAGPHTLRRWMFTGGGFQSSSAPAVHFGRPAETPPGATAALTVVWPDGYEQRVEGVAWGRRITVRRSSAE